jgi:hypothetical protein
MQPEREREREREKREKERERQREREKELERYSLFRFYQVRLHTLTRAHWEKMVKWFVAQAVQ